MAYSNNVRLITSPPNFIVTSQFTNEEKDQISPIFTAKLYYFAKSFSNPLTFPFPLTIDVIVHGDITLGTTRVKCETFCIDTVTSDKIFITGYGNAFLWYRYGNVSPSDFTYLMNYAIQNNAYNEIDALLHTRSITEAIDYILSNNNLWIIFMNGYDWQLNEIGFNEFLKYLSGLPYDPRAVAKFLTIANYLFPDAFKSLMIKPIKTTNIGALYSALFALLTIPPPVTLPSTTTSECTCQQFVPALGLQTTSCPSGIPCGSCYQMSPLGYPLAFPCPPNLSEAEQQAQQFLEKLSVQIAQAANNPY